MFFNNDNGPDETVRLHQIGEDVSLLSADEIAKRIALLQAEIRRLETDRSFKNHSREAAEALFRL